MILHYLAILWPFCKFSQNHGLEENGSTVIEFLCNNNVCHHSHTAKTHFHWVLCCFPSVAAGQICQISTCLPYFVLIPTQSVAFSTRTIFLWFYLPTTLSYHSQGGSTDVFLTASNHSRSLSKRAQTMYQFPCSQVHFLMILIFLWFY